MSQWRETLPGRQLLRAGPAARGGRRRCARRRGSIHDVYAPYPVHGLDQAMGIRRSRLPFVTLLAGLGGLCFALAFQYYTAVFDWPLDVGGKPENSTLAFVPVCFELTVLFGGLGTVGAFLLRAPAVPGQARAAPGAGRDQRRVRVVAHAPRGGNSTPSWPAACMLESGADEVAARRHGQRRRVVTGRASAAAGRRSGWPLAVAAAGCGAGRQRPRAASTCPTWRAGPPTRRSRPTPPRARPDAAGARRRDDRARPPAVPFHYRAGRGGGGARRPRAGEPAAADAATLEDGRASTRPTASSATARAARATARWSSRQDPDAARRTRRCAWRRSRPAASSTSSRWARRTRTRRAQHDAVVRGAADAEDERWKVGRLRRRARRCRGARRRHDRPRDAVWREPAARRLLRAVAVLSARCSSSPPAGDQRALVGGAAPHPGGVHVRDAGVRLC